MIVDVISHDKAEGTALIKFSHNDVVFTQQYDLKMVIPGTVHVLAGYGMEFTEAMQQTVIDRLIAQVQRDIEAGVIQNRPT